MDNRNFKLKYLDGLVRIEDIDDYVDEWHLGDSTLELFEYLGLTENEYFHYINTGKLLFKKSVN